MYFSKLTRSFYSGSVVESDPVEEQIIILGVDTSSASVLGEQQTSGTQTTKSEWEGEYSHGYVVKGEREIIQSFPVKRSKPTTIHVSHRLR